ncbi:MAG: protein kinase [Fibrobacter sp.]|nr:protein kinase [Fibrobacter sp.]
MAENETSSAEDRSSIRIRNMLASIERTFLPVNTVIGKYRIIEEIDRGGMAVVYKAIQMDLNRVVALKVMPANISINHGFVERFLSEAHAIAQLNHPNIVKIIEVATEGNIYYLAMEYIPGQNLYYFLHYQKPKLVDVLEIIIKLTEALTCAHGQKIIHRDLKLNNVIMRDQLSPVLIDFGLAKAMENDESLRPGITRTGEVMGSPSYMAPERLLGGPVDQRSDICSLGIMLYEMLTFKNPYLDQRNLHQTTINVMESNPIPPRRLVPWLPIEIEAITLKAMAKDPANRYQTMGQFKADIQNYINGDPIIARPPTIISRVRHFVKKQWAPLAIGFTILVFSVLFAAMFYLQSKKGQSHWQPIFTDQFDEKSHTADWIFTHDPVNDPSQRFFTGNEDLRSAGKGTVAALLNKHFNRDIMITCDFLANPDDLYNCGIFLSGNTPDSSYCFHINRNGRGETGITLPGSRFLIRDVPPGKVPLLKRNRVIVERINDQITFTMNNVIVTQIYDNFPVLGRGHDKLGIFINKGACRVDNIKVYRRATPQVPSPMLIADRFMERGDFEAAMDEYTNLLIDFAQSSIANEIKLKMINCLIRLEKNAEALELLNSFSTLTPKEERYKPYLSYLHSKILVNQGYMTSADTIYQYLADNYGASSINLELYTRESIDLFNLVTSNRFDSARQQFYRISGRYKKDHVKNAQLFELLTSYYFKTLQNDSVIALSAEIYNNYKGIGACALTSKYLSALAYLNKGKKDTAKLVLDQLITGNALPERSTEMLYIMGQITEFDFSYKEALLLYRRLFQEASRSNELTWMAAIAQGLLLCKDSGTAANTLFKHVQDGDHIFPQPRLIASYFQGMISDSVFYQKWQVLSPDNPWYLYYQARKRYCANDMEASQRLLNQLLSRLSKKEWSYFRIFKIVTSMDRW